MNEEQHEQSKETILVLGATGKTGRRVASRLQAAGVSLRRGSRSASPAFDWEDDATWDAALSGVQAAYVAYPQDLPIQAATQRIEAFITRAKGAGVQRIVLLTGRGEADGLRQEQMLRASGLEWTVVRSAWFNQNFSEGGFAEMVESGELALPSDRAPEPYVDLDDLAEVVAVALTRPGHSGEVYEVTGPRLLTFLDVATALGVTYVPLSHAEFIEGLKASGMDEEAIGLMDFLFGPLLDGRNARLGDGVRRALGREPKAFTAFAQRVRNDNARTLRRFVTDFINGGDEEVLRELVHTDYVYRTPGEEVFGRDGLAAMFRGYRSAFPDLSLEVQDLLVAGDKTVLDFSLRGTQRGEFMGIPASGRPFDIRGVVISQFRDGKIAEEWELLDVMGMLEQLGAVAA